jgi:hypothetical protein
VKRAWPYIAILVLAPVVAISTLSFTPSVRRGELRSIAYGYPIHFAKANADWMSPPPGRRTAVPFSPWDDQIRFDLGMFLASAALIAAVPIGIRIVFQARHRSRLA